MRTTEQLADDDIYKKGACHCGTVRFRVRLRNGISQSAVAITRTVPCAEP